MRPSRPSLRRGPCRVHRQGGARSKGRTGRGPRVESEAGNVPGPTAPGCSLISSTASARSVHGGARGDEAGLIDSSDDTE